MIKEILNADVMKIEADVLAHQTNCVGVMGAGVARLIKNELSKEEFEKYVSYCRKEKGKALSTVQYLKRNNGQIICNLFGENIPTGIGLDTNYNALTNAFKQLKEDAKTNNWKTIVIPGYIGCGLAGGDWNIVKSQIRELFENDEDIELIIAYHETNTYNYFVSLMNERKMVVDKCSGATAELSEAREKVLSFIKEKLKNNVDTTVSYKIYKGREEFSL